MFEFQCFFFLPFKRENSWSTPGIEKHPMTPAWSQTVLYFYYNLHQSMNFSVLKGSKFEDFSSIIYTEPRMEHSQLPAQAE